MVERLKYVGSCVAGRCWVLMPESYTQSWEFLNVGKGDQNYMYVWIHKNMIMKTQNLYPNKCMNIHDINWNAQQVFQCFQMKFPYVFEMLFSYV